MNKQNILALADLIEQLPEGRFSMTRVTLCRTPACIAGWAAWLEMGKPEQMPPNNGFNWESEFYESGETIIDKACEFIGSSDYLVRAELFMGKYGLSDCVEVKQEQAAAVLRHFAATGEVNWELPA